MDTFHEDDGDGDGEIPSMLAHANQKWSVADDVYDNDDDDDIGDDGVCLPSRSSKSEVWMINKTGLRLLRSPHLKMRPNLGENHNL